MANTARPVDSVSATRIGGGAGPLDGDSFPLGGVMVVAVEENKTRRL